MGVELPERRLTARLARFFATDARDVTLGIGDDAAVVRNHGRASVLCCDPVIAGVHFAPGTPLGAVGRKAVARNLSDLAAMGATPDYLLLSVVFSRGTATPEQDALFRGVRAAARAVGASVVGGDVAIADGPLVATVTAIGHLKGRALRRDAARVGDHLHVTGALGGSGLGRHLRCRSRVREGEWLATRSPVRCAIDLSDGLLLDLHTVLQASGVPGAELEARSVPLHADARRLARTDGTRALDHALGDGEDHELLFTVRARAELPTGKVLTPRAMRPIGRLVARPGLWLVEADGSRRELAPRGWQHPL